MEKMSGSPTGPSVRFVFASLPTRMIVVKLGDGSLWINSPVAVSRETLDQIDVIGPGRYLVAPTALHIWRLEQWTRYSLKRSCGDRQRFCARLR